MNYKDTLAAGFRPSRMTNREFRLEELFSHFYEYGNTAVPGGDVFEQTLHLMASGGGRCDMPFGARFTLRNTLLIISTEDGEVRLTGSSGRFSIPAGRILVYPCNATFSLSAVVIPWTFRIYLITGGGLDLYTPLIRSPELFDAAAFPRIRIYEERIDTIRDNVSTSSLLKMHRYITDTVTSFCTATLPEEEEASPHLPSYLRAMHDFILNRSDGTFSLRSFEEQFGISRYRLCREYSKAFGISPLRDFNRVRIEKAKNMLLTSGLQVQEISSRIGFENVNHFIHLFSRETGLTPGQFRRKAQEDKI